MKKSILIISFLCLTISCFSQKAKNSKNNLKQKIDNYLKEIIEVNEIPGSAVAVIKNGKVIYEKYYGKSSIEENTLVNENRIFRLYSTTKLISAVAVFQLIEKNKLSLEDKIAKYLDNLPEEWQDVKIKNLITHSSGLPDIVKFEDIPYSLDESEKWSRLYKKPMEFETGDYYSYNQTNYCLLTKIIEKTFGSTFEDYVLKNQFPSAKKGVVFSANSSESIPDRVIHHLFDFKKNRYERFNADHGKIHNSGSGLNITLKEFIAWNERLDENILLNPATKNSMWSPFQFKNTKDNFLYGWGIYETNKIKSFGFSGGNMTAFRKFIDNDLTIIFLSNGYKNYNVEEQVIDHIAGIVDEKLLDSNLLADEKITSDFYKNDFEKAVKNYDTIKNQNPTRNFENRLITIGYNLMNNENLKDAIKVFEFNVKENPNSSNAYDCVAEAYFANGQLELSKQNYQKSFDMYSGNTNAKDMVNKIDEMLKK
ncbi:serine hydrolase domain-containing protein [Flavobacterium gawalongense]|uniref:Beta-lactamase family protein n=2 Tax=Flavobacterium TaxID=237 RepID=A0A553BN39_9FLAO|nr:serine hydrolase domain-containing protein [Flavobacterium gawalongense]TRX00140.1 beta-lactamase family protein [Flavobacterium gawalongense]TRX04888.1 beta-lactamase family protein [Flavobacterium gawalongense]TRX09666.1 beta-lactamase family protein [Flavobacterium gawalongense]TRX10850.1 beta-lactamase family protein [Flavobacterium gawalongense]TRX28071.1 beta-lactamase family protein [Flavobacterium gawalongense]